MKKYPTRKDNIGILLRILREILKLVLLALEIWKRFKDS